MSPRLKNITARSLIRALEKDGFILKRQKGSHRIYKHPDRGNWVSVPYHHSAQTLPTGFLHGLIEDAGWTDDDLIRLRLQRKG